MSDLAVLCLKLPIAGQDDVQSSWQPSANRFVGFAAHDYWLAPGDLPKSFEIIWQMPGQIAIPTYDAILRHGDDQVGAPVVTWHIAKAVPVKVSAPTYDATTNDVAIDTLEVMATKELDGIKGEEQQRATEIRGQADAEVIRIAAEAGADAVVKMPFRPDELRAAVTEAIAQRSNG